MYHRCQIIPIWNSWDAQSSSPTFSRWSMTGNSTSQRGNEALSWPHKVHSVPLMKGSLTGRKTSSRRANKATTRHTHAHTHTHRYKNDFNHSAVRFLTTAVSASNIGKKINDISEPQFQWLHETCPRSYGSFGNLGLLLLFFLSDFSLLVYKTTPKSEFVKNTVCEKCTKRKNGSEINQIWLLQFSTLESAIVFCILITKLTEEH